jgi:hypothetical protein
MSESKKKAERYRRAGMHVCGSRGSSPYWITWGDSAGGERSDVGRKEDRTVGVGGDVGGAWWAS